MDACRTNEFTDVVVVQETRGEPDGLIVCHLPLGPTAFFTLSNCVLRHDIAERGPVSEVYPHLIFDNFSTPLGKRVQDILKFLFPVPKVCCVSCCVIFETSIDSERLLDRHMKTAYMSSSSWLPLPVLFSMLIKTCIAYGGKLWWNMLSSSLSTFESYAFWLGIVN